LFAEVLKKGHLAIVLRFHLTFREKCQKKYEKRTKKLEKSQVKFGRDNGRVGSGEGHGVRKRVLVLKCFLKES
jgi:hypothetical protein